MAIYLIRDVKGGIRKEFTEQELEEARRIADREALKLGFVKERKGYRRGEEDYIGLGSKTKIHLHQVPIALIRQIVKSSNARYFQSEGNSTMREIRDI